jgi:hypothetical protein
VSEIDYCLLAANALRRRSLATRESNFSRDVGVSLIAQTIEKKTRRAKLKRQVWAVSASAAALAIVSWWGIGAQRSFTKSATPSLASCSSPSGCSRAPTPIGDLGVVDGRTIEPGSRITAAADRATNVDLRSGTHLALTAGSLLSYDEGAENHRFTLFHGSVHLEVNKLAANQRFLVDTPDTEVEVRGTVFDVGWQDAADHCGKQTHVTVTEGVVEVRHRGTTVLVTAGKSWPEPCVVSQRVALGAARLVPRNTPTPVRRSEAIPGGGLATGNEMLGFQPPSPTGNAEPSPTKRASDLAEQNDLFARASAARHAGNESLAIRLYDELLTRFPRSPLTESAISSRLTLLKSGDPKRARYEAKRYLEAYPSGFSRKLAESILQEP